jgi:ABC-2 type transport system ATP-binding protein
MSRTFAIETHGLTKKFGKFAAVRSLDLRVAAYRTTGFLGRNGAGKSTTIKMLLGMIHPTGGNATVLGRTVTDERANREMRRKIACVGEDKQLYRYMTVEQLIRFTKSFYSDWVPDVHQRLLKRYQLPLDRKVKALSKGMRTKLALLLALSRRPELLILDEPGEGLDPVAVEDLLQDLVSAGANGITVFFSAHQITEVERIAEQVCILDQGELVADLSLEDMRKDYRRITLGFSNEPQPGRFRLPGVRNVQTSGRQVTMIASGNADAIVEIARDMGPVSVDVAPIGLREVFLDTVKTGAA